MGESKLYKSLINVAWLMIIFGSIVAVFGFFIMEGGGMVGLAGILVGGINGMIFFYFAKILEQNYDRERRLDDIYRLLSRIDTKMHEEGR